MQLISTQHQRFKRAIAKIIHKNVKNLHNSGGIVYVLYYVAEYIAFNLLFLLIIGN
jgi:hypothetical protein